MTKRIRVSHPFKYLAVPRPVGSVIDVPDEFAGRAVAAGLAAYVDSGSVPVTALALDAGLALSMTNVVDSRMKAVPGARVRDLGGYKAPSTRCPTTKCAVSVTLNAFDGYTSGGVTYKINEMQAIAECNWTPNMTNQFVQANYNYWSVFSGPWSPSETSAPSYANGAMTGKQIKPMDFTFMFEGTYLCVANLFVAGTWINDVRIWIDDEEIADWYLGTRAAGTLQGKSSITASSLGTGNHIFNLNFPTRGTYKVRIAGLVTTLGGAAFNTATTGNLMTIGPLARVWKPGARAQIGVISDSWFDTIYTNTSQNPAIEMAHHLNANIWNCAQSGSGFNNPSGSGVNGDRTFGGTLVWDAINRCPPLDLIVINGTANDLGYTEAQNVAAMQATFNRARAYRADIPIVWVGIEPQSYFKGIYTLPVMKARENALLAVAQADPNVVAAIPACNEEWLWGTGRVGATVGDGNQDFVTGADAVHLSEYGTRFIGKMIAERMKSAMALV